MAITDIDAINETLDRPRDEVPADVCHGSEIFAAVERLLEHIEPFDRDRTVYEAEPQHYGPIRSSHPFITSPPLDYFILPIP